MRLSILTLVVGAVVVAAGCGSAVTGWQGDYRTPVKADHYEDPRHDFAIISQSGIPYTFISEDWEVYGFKERSDGGMIRDMPNLARKMGVYGDSKERRESHFAQPSSNSTI